LLLREGREVQKEGAGVGRIPITMIAIPACIALELGSEVEEIPDAAERAVVVELGKRKVDVEKEVGWLPLPWVAVLGTWVIVARVLEEDGGAGGGGGPEGSGMVEVWNVVRIDVYIFSAQLGWGWGDNRRRVAHRNSTGSCRRCC
jgi:hypothetical protein